jgi:hypothetical protein
LIFSSKEQILKLPCTPTKSILEKKCELSAPVVIIEKKPGETLPGEQYVRVGKICQKYF